jgi:D-psicose/D-tagatose/L-ribulose 3-epimerase
MMKRSLGVCTWTYGPQDLKSIAGSLAYLGFDGVELHGDLETFQPTETARLLGDHGLSILSLTPGDCDPAHPDIAIRQAAIDYYRRLIDFAVQARDAGAGLPVSSTPIVSFHGLVTRIKPIGSQEEEYSYLVESIRTVDQHAAEAGISLVYEVLNRYESHLINTGAQALRVIRDAEARAIRVLLDTYHMNIEERNLAQTIHMVGDRLGLFHVADSNREGLGCGHIDFASVVDALDAIGYAGPIIVECTATGPNPFTPVKGEDYLQVLELFLRDSRDWLASRHLEGTLVPG